MVPYIATTTVILVAGIQPLKYWMNSLVQLKTVSNVPFCGASNWREHIPEADFGIELALPPMWKLLLSPAEAPPPAMDPWSGSGGLTLQQPAPEPFGAALHPQSSLAGLACELQLLAQVRWSTPADTRRHALSLAARGPCALAVQARLPELAALSVFVTGNGTVPWVQVERRAMRCISTLQGAYWQFTLDASAWPEALSRGRPCSEILAGQSGSLEAFLCLPSRFPIDETSSTIPREEMCDMDAALREALPLLLAERSGCFEALAAAGPPLHATVAGGEHSFSATEAQLAFIRGGKDPY